MYIIFRNYTLPICHRIDEKEMCADFIRRLPDGDYLRIDIFAFSVAKMQEMSSGGNANWTDQLSGQQNSLLPATVSVATTWFLISNAAQLDAPSKIRSDSFPVRFIHATEFNQVVGHMFLTHRIRWFQAKTNFPRRDSLWSARFLVATEK